MEKISIIIPVYNGADKLERCLESINTKYVNDIEILVSEDHSPLSTEIESMVNSVKNTSAYSILFSSNEVNLGYDMNLGSIIQKSNGKYVFL